MDAAVPRCTGGDDWLCHRNMDENKVSGLVLKRIRVAHGSITLICAGSLSVVPALVATVPALCLDGADYRLDRKHHPYLLRLASAYPGATMVGSWLGHAAGIWGHRHDRRHDRVATRF